MHELSPIPSPTPQPHWPSPVVAPDARCRRRSRRRPLDASVRLLRPTLATGTTINASAGGLRIAVDCNLFVGDPLSMDLQFEGGSRMSVRGEVVWVRPCRDGVVAGVRYTD